MNKYFLTIDLGASSGRLVVSIKNKKRIMQEEVYRFINGPLNQNGRLYWDFESILNNIYCGIKLAIKRYPLIESIGIDSFGVDFGLLDEKGTLVRNPICYRDQTHTSKIQEVDKIIPRCLLYKETGIQYLKFNSLYQLYYLANYEKDTYSKTRKILLIPDLIAYFLTGEMRVEVTNLSTTNLYNFENERFIDSISELGIDSRVFPKLIYPSEIYGYLTSDIKKSLDIENDIKVVAVCTHDTASAVLTVLEDYLYISSGTWSLVGATIEESIKTENAFSNNFTNEIGFNHKTRFLKNVMGLWMLNNLVSEIMKEDDSFDYYSTLQGIVDFSEFTNLIDIDNDIFYDGENLIEKINAFLQKSNQNKCESNVDYIKTILMSMAMKYRYTIDLIESNTDKVYKGIQIIGGGNQIHALNQLTADVCNKEVIVGAKEATALGNSVVLMCESDSNEDINEYLSLIDKANIRFVPEKGYESLYCRFIELMEGKENE